WDERHLHQPPQPRHPPPTAVPPRHASSSPRFQGLRMRSTLGFRVKSGWAAAVLIATAAKAPTVRDSRVIDLSDPDVPDSRQPYHAGFGTEQTDTAKVTRLVRGIEQFSRRQIAALLKELGAEQRVRRAAVVVASLTDPASI